MQIFRIGKNEAGQRLDKFLHKYLPNAQSGFIYKMLRKKNITLNKTKCTGAEIVSEGDTVESFFSDETFDKFRGVPYGNAANKIGCTTDNNESRRDKKNLALLNKSDIIFEDLNFLLVYKKAGILSQKSKPDDYSLNEWLIDYMLSEGQITEDELKTFHPSVCNRLDRNTAGIVICGKSLHGIQTMDKLISTKKIEKHYLALCQGNFVHEGRIRASLVKDTNSNVSKIVFDNKDKTGSEIITEFKVLKKYENACLLDVNLLTGKSHQIRAQLSALGNPIVGDAKYGGSTKIMNTQFLLAYKLIFPASEELPEDMKQYADRIFEINLPPKFSGVLECFEK